MLVLDPKKRLTIEQVCQQQWMLAATDDVKRDPLVMPDFPHAHEASRDNSNAGGVSSTDVQYNEHVLRVMRNINIDEQKTLQVGCSPSADC
jgi:hypothetical protein